MSKSIPREKDFEYLTRILAFILCPDFDSSAENISRSLKLPIEQIRQDFSALLSIREISSNLYFDPQNFDADTANISKEQLNKQLLCGSLDHVPLCIDETALYMNLDSDSEIPIWLRYIEFMQLKTQFPNLYMTTFKKTGVRLKNPTPVFYSNTNAIIEYADNLKAAIERNACVSFRYKAASVPKEYGNMNSSPHQIGQDVTVYPQYLYHDTDKNLIYCVALELKASDNGQEIDSSCISCKIFRLDRISRYYNKPFLTPTLSELPDEALQQVKEICQKLDYMWGMSSFKEEPVPVKIRIFANTPNIISKIKAETSQRKYGKLTKDEIGYIYTDTIIGTDNFRSWLRGYGSSVVVMEPQFLADEMKVSARKVIQMYSSSESELNP